MLEYELVTLLVNELGPAKLLHLIAQECKVREHHLATVTLDDATAASWASDATKIADTARKLNG